MGYEPILKLIFKMSLPAMFSMLIQALYNIVDSMYVAQISDKALSALGLVFPLQMLVIAFSVGTGVGILSLISRRLGEKRIEDADAAVVHGIIICNCEYLVFLLIGLFAPVAFCKAFTSDPALVEPGSQYLRIVLVGSVFVFNTICAERVMQACGNMILPTCCMLVGSITNIVLDPILIFGKLGFPAMGVRGAAIATIFSQFASMCCAYTFLFTKDFEIKLVFKGFKWKWQIFKDIFQVALPSILMQTVMSFTDMSLNKILVNVSTVAVGVRSAYGKVQSFVFMPVLGMNQGTMPIMGYSFGAKNKDRLMSTYKNATIIGFIIMACGCLIFQLFPRQLLGLFNPTEEMLAIGLPAFRIISLCFPFIPFSVIPSTLFQATGHGYYSMFISIMRQVLFIIPIAFILSKTLGATGVWLAYPLAEGSGLIVSNILLYRLYKKELKNLNQE